MHRISLFAVIGVATLAWGAPAHPLLPQSFAEWRAVPPTDVPGAPGAPGAPLSGVLQECGMTQYEGAMYGGGNGSHGNGTVIIRAWQFKDATGAYSAFTLLRRPEMHVEKVGNEGAASSGHFVFRMGTTVVEAVFMPPVPDESAALSALAALLPPATGTRSIEPSMPQYLPAAGLDATTVRYAIGPAAWAQMGEAIPAGTVDFSQDTEAVVAQYGAPGAQETLSLLLYPTPQIAGAHLKGIDAAAKPLGMVTKRSGPLVAIAGGSYSAAKARQLLDAVKFNDMVTINHPEGYVSETMKLYGLLRGITVLVVILVCAALLLGLFLGGGRALVRRLRGKPVSSVSEEEFISLHLNG